MIVSGSIRFVTPKIALVDASKTQFGSLTVVRSVPLLFVLVKQGASWRIAAIQLFASPAPVHI